MYSLQLLNSWSLRFGIAVDTIYIVADAIQFSQCKLRTMSKRLLQKILWFYGIFSWLYFYNHWNISRISFSKNQIQQIYLKYHNISNDRCANPDFTHYYTVEKKLRWLYSGFKRCILVVKLKFVPRIQKYFFSILLGKKLNFNSPRFCLHNLKIEFFG